MNIKKENIQYFINQESYYSPKKTIRNILPALVIFYVPIAIFGAYSNITSVVNATNYCGALYLGYYIIKESD